MDGKDRAFLQIKRIGMAFFAISNAVSALIRFQIEKGFVERAGIRRASSRKFALSWNR